MSGTRLKCVALAPPPVWREGRRGTPPQVTQVSQIFVNIGCMVTVLIILITVLIVGSVNLSCVIICSDICIMLIDIVI